MEKTFRPAAEALQDWSLVVEIEFVQTRIDDFRRGRGIAPFKVGSGIESTCSKKIRRRCRDDNQDQQIDKSAN